MKDTGKLSDIYSFQYGKGNDNPDNGGIYPVYGSNGVIGGYDKYNNEDAPVIGHIGANAGSVVFAKGKHFVTYNGIMCNIKNCADKMYGYYALLASNLKQIAFGSAQPFVSYNTLNRIPIFLPPLDKQRHISSILSAYDNLIEVNNKRIKVLEQMAENLYKEWFVRFRFPGHETAEFENGIPKGWEYCLLDSIAFVTMGQSPESQYYNYDSIGLPFHQGVGSYGEYYLVDDMYSSQGVRIAEPNSIIFSVRAPVGRINLTLNRIILGRGVAGINSKEGKNWFLLYLLKNRFSAEDLIGNGSIFSSVKKEELLKQRFLIPSSSLIDEFDSFARKIESQIRLAYLSNKNLVKQRDLLLPRLMSGKLEV